MCYDTDLFGDDKDKVLITCHGEGFKIVADYIANISEMDDLIKLAELVKKKHAEGYSNIDPKTGEAKKGSVE